MDAPNGQDLQVLSTFAATSYLLHGMISCAKRNAQTGGIHTYFVTLRISSHIM